MKLYADAPARRLGQVLSDVALVLWVVACGWAGLAVHDATLVLTGPGEQLERSATGMASGLRDAGGALDDLPLVGDAVSSPFDRAAGGADDLRDAGRATVEAVEQLADVLGLVVAVLPVLVALAIHLPRRLRFVREATAGARFLDSGDDLDLFALRALAHQPLSELARVSDDPAGAWRRREPDVVARLALLELRATGLRQRRSPVAQGAGPAA